GSAVSSIIVSSEVNNGLSRFLILYAQFTLAVLKKLGDVSLKVSGTPCPYTLLKYIRKNSLIWITCISFSLLLKISSFNTITFFKSGLFSAIFSISVLVCRHLERIISLFRISLILPLPFTVRCNSLYILDIA